MSDKPRPKKLRPGQRPKVKRQMEFRNCDAPNCSNIVASWAVPSGHVGRVYCILHRNMETET